MLWKWLGVRIASGESQVSFANADLKMLIAVMEKNDEKV